MHKFIHEFRDPIHNFIYVTDDERKVINSKYFQRLRYIHQLAMTYLVYPGASHKRFEHSLGVMALATRVYDIITDPKLIADKEVIENCSEFLDHEKTEYWRKVVRMAALCHDLGHLPFSHAAEKEILPNGIDHEMITYQIITEQMKDLWEKMTPPVRASDIAKIAIGQKKINRGKKPDDEIQFSDWERILSEILTGDAFGVDRMDYLLRDSYHIGVAYGKFDHYRLIDSIKLCYYRPDESSDTGLYLGLEIGGINSAEAMMLARYYMFNQVYLYRLRRIYDFHLKEFMKLWLESNETASIEDIMELTDNDILSAMQKQSKEPTGKLSELAKRIINRDHFKQAYSFSKIELAPDLDAGKKIFENLKSQFSSEDIYYDHLKSKSGRTDFPVIMRNGSIEISTYQSNVIQHIPEITLDTIYANKTMADNVTKWIENNKKSILEES
ncbi:MAG: HD domain-containing protein [Candidatus Cloacimonadaceae bacterium]|nr:HD domain-containing protein [Candidatus Cloacimonadaceae bacterium]